LSVAGAEIKAKSRVIRPTQVVAFVVGIAAHRVTPRGRAPDVPDAARVRRDANREAAARRAEAARLRGAAPADAGAGAVREALVVGFDAGVAEPRRRRRRRIFVAVAVAGAGAAAIGPAPAFAALRLARRLRPAPPPPPIGAAAAVRAAAVRGRLATTRAVDRALVQLAVWGPG